MIFKSCPGQPHVDSELMHWDALPAGEIDSAILLEP